MSTQKNDIIDLTTVPQNEWREKYIGDGYRYCCYKTATVIEERGGRHTEGRIYLFGYDKSNEPKTFICPWKCHIAYNVGYKTKWTDIFGRYVQYKYFDDTRQRRNFMETSEGLNVIECFPPQNEFLHEMFDSVALDENFNKQPMRIHYFDIETEISDSFEYPKTARNRINMMTIYDTKMEKYYTWSLQKCEKKFGDEYDDKGNLVNESPLKDMPLDKFVLFDEFYNNESSMLTHFINWFSDNYPDALCAHNGQAFDFPYLVNRIERVLGNPSNVDDYDMMDKKRLSDITKRLSPVGRVSIRMNNLDNERANKQAEIMADIDGIFLVDSLILFRDKYKIHQPLDGGNGLDNIGEVEVGAHKIHYEGTLKELYETQYDKFYFYNLVDVDLLRRVEEKVKMIPLSRSITSSGLSNYDAIYSSIGYLIGSLSMFSKTQMGTIFTSYKNKKDQSIPFEGAFVFPPEPGLYKNGICTVDFSSLYPSTIRSLGISIETYVGKISRFPIEDPKSEFFAKEPPIDLNGTDVIGKNRKTEEENEYSLKYQKKFSGVKSDKEIERFYFLGANGEKKMITRKQLDKLLETKCIFTRNNTLFLKHSVKKGVISTWSKHFYNLRKQTKGKMQKLEMDLYNKKIPENKIEETKTTIENLNASQQALKIALNSLYGCLSSPFSPVYNPYISQSITRNGKFCNLSASEFIRKWMKENYNIDDAYISTVSGDTDSQFISIRCITEDWIRNFDLPKNLNDWSDEKKLELWNSMSNFVKNTLNPYVQNLVREWCHTEHPEVLTYALEYMADNGIYESKKHYAVRKIVSEGPELVDKIKYSGIELKKASIPKPIKKFLNEMYTNTLTKNWNDNDFRNYLSKVYPEFEKMDIEDIAKWQGYSTSRESDGFLSMAKGATGISKACTFYNQLLDHLKIGDKYDSILLGDKVKVCYIKPTNKFGINIIAFKDGQYPDEFRKLFEVDYETMWDKLIISPLKNFVKATGFNKHPFDPRNQNIMDPDDL